ncbi:MAG: hypothetical protein Q8O39_00920 [bacterium]|nr:hypothetical protein [bacterium]
MLEINLCGKKLKSPLILASGTLGENKENLIECLKYNAGAVATRTLRVNSACRELFRPAYYFGDNFMLNADNQNITPWTYWLENNKDVERYGPLIISLSARNPDDCKTIVSAFEKKCPPSFYELNFSCPHSAKIYGEIPYKDVEKSLGLIKKETKRAVFLKLSLNNVNIKQLKKLESKKLVDAFVLSNSIGPGLKIDVEKKKPVLGSTVGGMSGPAIKPLVLAKIYELRQQIKKPIIGVGGIANAKDVLEYIILGCEAVQIYTTVHLRGPKVFEEINQDLKNFLIEKKESLSSIRGSLII